MANFNQHNISEFEVGKKYMQLYLSSQFKSISTHQMLTLIFFPELSKFQEGGLLLFYNQKKVTEVI